MQKGSAGRRFHRDMPGAAMVLASVCLGIGLAGPAISEQLDRVTGLPDRAIDAATFRTVNHFKILVEIEYYHDRISKAALTAAAPEICARYDMTVDKIIIPPNHLATTEMDKARTRYFQVRCQ